MIRGTTSNASTILYYQERVVAWIRCEEVLRSTFFEEAVIRLRLGEEERTDGSSSAVCTPMRI